MTDSLSTGRSPIDLLDTLSRFESELNHEPDDRRREFLLAILGSMQWDFQLTRRSRAKARDLVRRFRSG